MTQKELNMLYYKHYDKHLMIHKQFNNPSINNCLIFCEIAIEQFLYLYSNPLKESLYQVNWRINFAELYSFCLHLVKTVHCGNDESVIEVFLDYYTESGKLLFEGYSTNFN